MKTIEDVLRFLKIEGETKCQLEEVIKYIETLESGVKKNRRCQPRKK